MNALQDIHAVDFYNTLADPLFARCLRDLGADAIKVTPVEHGDKTADGHRSEMVKARST